MYSSILKIILFSFIFYKTTEAADLLEPVEEGSPDSDDNTIYCTLASLNIKLSIGDSYSPQNKCIQYVCNDRGEIERLTCGVKKVGKGCKVIKVSRKLSYPECCNIVRCTDDDGNVTDY